MKKSSIVLVFSIGGSNSYLLLFIHCSLKNKNMEARFEEFKSAIADLALSDITSAGWAAYYNWLAQWGAYIQNGNVTHPPHKPPF